MQDQATRAGILTAIANSGPLPYMLDLGHQAREEAHSIAAELLCDLGERAMRPKRQPGRLARFARTAARHPLSTGRTCVHAAKMLPTVRKALPWWVWPILGLATAVKMLPLDFGADETLFAVAFLLILWQRPGLLEALYREASTGKPARCQCAKHAKWNGGQKARKAAAR